GDTPVFVGHTDGGPVFPRLNGLVFREGSGSFAGELRASNLTLSYCDYLDTSQSGTAAGVAVDSLGRPHCAGAVSSQPLGMDTTNWPFTGRLHGGSDGFIATLTEQAPLPPLLISITSVLETQLDLSIRDQSITETSFRVAVVPEDGSAETIS